MNDDEKELLKLGAETAMKPLSDLVNRLFGGPVEEIGGMWTDALATRRKIRQIKLFTKLQRAIEEAGFDPRQIADNVWVPALQEASLQDGEEIQDIFANLLANAADPRQRNPVYPLFISMVKGLTPRDAKFLDALHAMLLEALQAPRGVTGIVKFADYEIKGAYSRAGLSRHSRIAPLNHGDLEEHGDDLREDLKKYEISLNLIMTLGILTEKVTTDPVDLRDFKEQVKRRNLPSKLKVESTTRYTFTDLGVAFLGACQPPSKL